MTTAILVCLAAYSVGLNLLLIRAYERHIETLKKVVASYEEEDDDDDEGPDDDPGDGEEPGPLQINVTHVAKNGNVIPMKKASGEK